MDMTKELAFPPHFVWGAATAAYQIEGAVDEDGRGESIWDRFSATPSKVRNDESGTIACDHYHRYKEDVALMAELGLRAYRFSIAWPRILPKGRGTVNDKGLDFYDRLVDELLSHGIEPYATLYHWDLPQALEDEGGWLNRATVDAFADYTGIVVRRLGDRIHHWITQNEPQVVSWMGYGWGKHAPGRTSQANAIAAAHHVLLAHGRATEVIRAESPDAQVGITLNMTPIYPASNSPEDAAAARLADGMGNRWFADPVFKGQYPADILELYEPDTPPIRDGDMRIISTPIDFLGLNNYSRNVVRADPASGRPAHVRVAEAEYTDMDWEVYPQGLRDLLLRVHRDYRPNRIYVTENGSSFRDVQMHDGSVHDPERQQYLEGYLAAASSAIAEGVPLAGYFVWSLLDNFEWAHGYWMRFGIVYVDYRTLERVPKKSAQWYSGLIKQQASVAMHG
jgi:beta-glucosidase